MNRGEHRGEVTGKWVGADVSIYRFEDLEGQNGPMSMFISGQPLPTEGKAQGPTASGIQRGTIGGSSLWGLVDEEDQKVPAEVVPAEEGTAEQR